MKFKIIANEQTPGLDPYLWSYEKSLIVEKAKLMVKFLSFARRQHRCAGLAANQVSCDGIRLMIPFFALHSKNFWDIIICPEIIQYIGEEEEKIEGCLTWLGKKILAKRFPEIEVRYFDIKRNEVKKRLSGFDAQVFQHEYNHLRGVPEIVAK
jgi:peptide deformylase